jgi:mRNA-degrading endonuclease RelE of RelBE toxin-antitoxin system
MSTADVVRSTLYLDAELHQALRDHPRAPGCERLVGSEELYRVRQGVYRIVYAIHDEQVVVEVLRVGHRGDEYRGRRSRRAALR